MAKISKEEAARQVAADPCLKNIDFTSMPDGGYEHVLRRLVTCDAWSEMQMKRDKIFRAAKQAWAFGQASKVKALRDQMEKHDQRMSSLFFYTCFNFIYDNNREQGNASLSQSDFKKKYIKTPEDEKMYDAYEQNWFKATFLLDIVDSYITDAVGSLGKIKGDDDISVVEFDDVREVQKIIKSHNHQSRQYVHQDICDLENGFIDSIQEFCDMQMTAFLPSLEMLRDELKRKGEIKDGYDDIAKSKTLSR